jgi:hypothetical protein
MLVGHSRLTINNFEGTMTRGLGCRQRHVLAALHQRADHDSYRADGAMLLSGGRCVLRARWRWYTIEMVGLLNKHSAESRRAAANQTIRTLARRGRVQVWNGDYPYPAPFAGHCSQNDMYVGTVNLAELHAIDSRWPPRHGRRLWFRLPPPPRHAIPVDDQIAVLNYLDTHRPEEFEDFAAALDRRRAWKSPAGQLPMWLLCGGTY